MKTKLANLLANIGRRKQRHRLNLEFKQEFESFRNLSKHKKRFPISWEDRYPQLHDKTSDHAFSRHYVYHTAWAARKLAETRPEFHVDISSSLFFVGISSAFVPIYHFDYRPVDISLSGLESYVADLTSLPFLDKSISSLSCLHTLEHIGLGRYGDPLDPDGDLKAISELTRVLAPGGNLLVAVPVGKQSVRFNAHRIYDPLNFQKYYSPLTLVEYGYIHELEGPIRTSKKAISIQDAHGPNGHCGLYWFTKTL